MKSLLFLCLTLVSSVAFATDFQLAADNKVQVESGATPERQILYAMTPDDYVWKNGPASFPRGTMYTVLEGDPYSAGSYTIRIKFPPNYKLPAHSHRDLEQLTVMSGEINIALGDDIKKEEALTIPTGGFTILKPKENYYLWTGKKEAIIQIHGTGPRVSIYVDKQNDPTWKKTQGAVGATLSIKPSVQKAVVATSKNTAKKLTVVSTSKHSKSIARSSIKKAVNLSQETKPEKSVKVHNFQIVHGSLRSTIKAYEAKEGLKAHHDLA